MEDGSMEDEPVSTDLPRAVARALASLALLAVFAVGVPVVLLRVAAARFDGYAPWSGIDPTGWRLEQLGEVLSSRLVESTVIDVLIRLCLLVVWVAVVVLVLNVVAEVVHRIRHDGIGLPSVRGLGWGQPIARFIATGLLVIAPMLGSSRISAAPTLPVRQPAVTAVFAEPQTHRWIDLDPAASAVVRSGVPGVGVITGERSSSRASSSSSTGTYTVAPGDSVYAIAERLAAAAPASTVDIAEQILDLNLGSEMPDGQRFTNAAYIEPGWVLLIPVVDTAGVRPSSGVGRAVDRYVVVTGDTLSGISAARLGDADRWPEIWHVNAGRQMLDGRTFDDPHLILPGWEIDVPVEPFAEHADPEPAAEFDADADSVVDAWSPPTERDSSVAATSAPPAAPTAAPSAPSTMAPSTTMPASTPVPASTTMPSTTTVSTAVGPGGQVGGVQATGRSSAPSPVGLGQAAMLSAGALMLLGALRSRRLRSSPPGARVPEPRPEPMAVERSMRALDAADRLVRVDLALRNVAGQVAERDRQVLALFVASDGAVEVVTTGPCELAAPWTGRAERWTLPGHVSVEALAAAARAVGAPCPALVQLGVAADGRDLFVDLETLGTLVVDAPAALADQVVVGLAATLGCSPFAEVARLIGVGVAEEAFLGHRHLELASSVAEALDLAAETIGSTAELADPTFALRARMVGGEAWEPAIVLIGADRTPVDGTAPDRPVPDGPVVEQTAPLAALRSCRPGRGLAVVCVGPVPDDSVLTRARLVLDGARWSLHVFAGDRSEPVLSEDLCPVGLSDGEIAQLGTLIDAASDPLDVSPSADHVDHLGHVDKVGHDHELDDRPPAIPDASANGHATSPTLMSFPDRGSDDAVASHSVAATDATDAVDHVELSSVPAGPEWSIMVRVLGPVEVIDRDGTSASFEKSKTRELIAWLVTHRDRSTRTGARTALWDLDVRDVTFANVVSAARRTMARLVAPPEGQEWLGRTQTEQLPVHPQVFSDAEVLADRVAAARGRAPDVAIEVLRPAVDLIRGMPFEGTSYLWPDADGLSSNLVLLATTAAAELAEHHLALGDVDGVFRATGRGLLALPGHEELIALRMRAHASAGDHAGVRHEWESYERVITSDPWSDGEPAPKLVELRRELLSPPA